MNINNTSVMNKVKAFAESPEGKRRIKECIEKYRKEGRGVTASGHKIAGDQMMLEAGAEMIRILQAAAGSMDLPQSVMDHFNSLECSRPQRQPDGSTIVYIYFKDDLSRESLEDDENVHTGDGIRNIVALFNNGCHAGNFVYGWWNNHEPTGNARIKSGSTGGKYAWVRSRKDREPLYFIQQAVSGFNAKYGSYCGASAVVGDDYL